MRWREFVSRRWALRRRVERQVREEMRDHVDQLVDELRGAGLSEVEAKRAARERFGSLDAHYRQARRVRLRTVRGSLRSERLLGLAYDVRAALRSLRAQPGFSLTAVGTLGVGVGATTLLFSLINAILFAPLPFEQADRLLRIRGAPLSTGDFRTITREQVLDWRPVVANSIADVAAYYPGAYSVNISGLGEPTEGGVTEVTHNFFSVLGQRMVLGSYFTSADTAEGVPAAVVGERIWRSHWSADPEVLGQQILINGRPYRLIGVVPAHAQLPVDVDVWVPMGIKIEDFVVWGARYFYYIGRLQPAANESGAAADLRSLQSYLESELGDRFGGELTMEPLHESVVGRARAPLWLLFGGVALLLLIALANLASYLLARSRGREREYALRSAMGAGRRRLLQQALSESCLLSAAGMVVALALASWATGLVRRASDLPLPRIDTLSVDWSLFLFAAAASAGCAVAFGLLPAVMASRPDVLASLRPSAAGGSDARRPGDWLVVLQIALAVVLASGAGLLTRSYRQLIHVDNGFDGGGLTFAMNLDQSIFEDTSDALLFVDELRRRTLAIPSVTAAGAVNLVPLASQPTIGLRYTVEGAPADSDDGDAEHRFATYLPISPGYLEAIGAQLRAGRLIDETDAADAPRVAVVNEEFVRVYIGSTNPLAGVGRRVLSGPRTDESKPIEIVGVIANVRHSGPTSAPYPQIYMPLAQVSGRPSFFAVRASTEVAAIAGRLREIVAELAPNLPVFDMRLMSERLSGTLAQPRLLAWLFSAVGLASVLLAAFGLHAVVAFWVAARTREIGVRRALGATPGRVFRELLRQGVARLAAGLTVGLAGYAIAARFVDTTLLFETGIYEPSTLAGVVAMVIIATLFGVASAARRATRLDPLEALRSE